MNSCANSVDACTDAAAFLRGRRIYHAAPLHYLPSIIVSDRLLAASIAARIGISARRTAIRRDRMLGVDAYVHLAFDPVTPLLRDKLRKGMPHVVLSFDAEAICAQRPADCALLPFNTKAWRARWSLCPVNDLGDMAAILRRRDEFGRCASLEFLVSSQLSLVSLVSVIVFGSRDELLVRALLSRFAPRLLPLIRLENIADYAFVPITETVAYFSACIEAGGVSAPPLIDFD